MKDCTLISCVVFQVVYEEIARCTVSTSSCYVLKIGVVFVTDELQYIQVNWWIV